MPYREQIDAFSVELAEESEISRVNKRFLPSPQEKIGKIILAAAAAGF